MVVLNQLKKGEKNMTKNKVINLRLKSENNVYVLISDERSIEIKLEKNEIKGDDIFNKIYLPNIDIIPKMTVDIKTDLQDDKSKNIHKQIVKLFAEIDKSISTIKKDN